MKRVMIWSLLVLFAGGIAMAAPQIYKKEISEKVVKNTDVKLLDAVKIEAPNAK